MKNQMTALSEKFLLCIVLFSFTSCIFTLGDEDKGDAASGDSAGCSVSHLSGGSIDSIQLGDSSRDILQNTYYLAQSFQAATNGFLNSAEFVMTNVDESTGTLILTLEEDSNGKPNGSSIARGTLSAREIPKGPGKAYRIRFESAAQIKKDRIYWLKLYTADRDPSRGVHFVYSTTDSFQDGMAKRYEEPSGRWHPTDPAQPGESLKSADFLFSTDCDEE